jgi:hypothetical protein
MCIAVAKYFTDQQRFMNEKNIEMTLLKLRGMGTDIR